MGANQLLLPHLGAQARILLDRIVASGACGVDGRDMHDWVLSRLIELLYVEESPLNDTAFVCTSAGRHRWQIEILADAQREATALRRQLIRQRLDERFSRLGLGKSTSLTIAVSPVEPRLHRGVPALSGPPQETLTSALAALFAAASVALVVIFGCAEPRDVRDWLFPPTLHAATAPVASPKANAKVAARMAAPVAATITAPVDPRTEAPPGRAVVSADAAQARTQPSYAASIDTIPPSQKPGYGGVIHQPEQDVRVPDGTLAKVEDAGRKGSAVADAASPDDGAIQNAAVTAAALIDSAVSVSGQIETDLATGVERGFRSIAAALLHARADTDRPVSARNLVTREARDDVPAPVSPAAEPPSERGQFAMLQPTIVHASPDQRVTTSRPAARAGNTDVDPQHAVVERLNMLSLAAARRGDVWRPNTPGDVAETGRPH